MVVVGIGIGLIFMWKMTPSFFNSAPILQVLQVFPDKFNHQIKKAAAESRLSRNRTLNNQKSTTSLKKRYHHKRHQKFCNITDWSWSWSFHFLPFQQLKQIQKSWSKYTMHKKITSASIIKEKHWSFNMCNSVYSSSISTSTRKEKSMCIKENKLVMKRGLGRSWTSERMSSNHRMASSGFSTCSVPSKFSYRSNIASLKRKQVLSLRTKRIVQENSNLNESWEFQPIKRSNGNMFMDLWKKGPTFDAMIDEGHKMDKPTMDQLIADIENTAEESRQIDSWRLTQLALEWACILLIVKL